jgi:hypothetical protein
VGSGYFGDAHLASFNDSRDKRTVKMTLEGRVPPASRELLSGASSNDRLFIKQTVPQRSNFVFSPLDSSHGSRYDTLLLYFLTRVS